MTYFLLFLAGFLEVLAVVVATTGGTAFLAAICMLMGLVVLSGAYLLD